MPANVKDKQGRQDANPEHGPPGNGSRQQPEKHSIEKRRDPPPDSPACLHCTDCFAPILSTNRLAHQNRTYRPFTPEPKSLQATNDQELMEVLGESARERKRGKPQDGQAQNANSSEMIGQDARKPP